MQRNNTKISTKFDLFRCRLSDQGPVVCKLENIFSLILPGPLKIFLSQVLNERDAFKHTN